MLLPVVCTNVMCVSTGFKCGEDYDVKNMSNRVLGVAEKCDDNVCIICVESIPENKVVKYIFLKDLL